MILLQICGRKRATAHNFSNSHGVLFMVRMKDCIAAGLIGFCTQIAIAGQSVTAEMPAAPPAEQCLTRSQLSTELTPVSLDRALTSCVTTSRLDAAVFLFALGGVYGRYDALRVADDTAGQAATIIRANAIQSMPAEKQEAFVQHVKAIMANADERATLCASVRSFGPPTYYPAYMVNHGMRAMQATMSGQQLENGGIRADFDSVKGWDAALAGYLQCD